MRVVLDTNVLLAAYGFGGMCRAVLDVCIDSHVLFLSEHILAELHRHLQATLSHSALLADQRVSVLREAATVVEPATVAVDACRDRDDLPVLGTALAAKADFLVTGDQDLLVIGKLADCTIVSPRQFWQRLK